MEHVLDRVLMYLKDADQKESTFRAFVGFDGFVDTLVRPVKISGGKDQMIFFDTIEEFGAYLESKAGKSCSIELDKITQKMGGNTVIYASALSSLGIYTQCVGAFGYPKIMDIFKQNTPYLEFLSVSDPGLCTALEFSDGKVMLSENQGINDIDYDRIIRRMGRESLCQMVGEADMVALMNWSEVPGRTDIWQGLLDDIFPELPENPGKKMFIDLSDCSRRTRGEIREMLELISRFSSPFDVILSLNENEFEILCKVCDIPGAEADIESAGKALRSLCPVKYLVVHLLNGAYAFSENNCCFTENRYVEAPVISTGGGDNFNAGLSYGMMIGMDIASALALANAASSFYVTRGHSADFNGLVDYIYLWKAAYNKEVS